MGNLANRTVLVVEDDPDTRELLRSALEDTGASVVTADSVEAALETFRQSPAHAVIADIRLGASDGYSLLKSIRELNLEYKGFTPMIAITGFASPDDKQRALAAGFDAYISKPFEPANVVSAVTNALSTPPDPTP